MGHHVSRPEQVRGFGSIHADRREQIGVVYCSVCRVDTLPDERTGRCFFCRTQLVQPPAKVSRFPAHRVRCQCGHNEVMHDHLGRCFDCPCGLFTPAEVRA